MKKIIILHKIRKNSRLYIKYICKKCNVKNTQRLDVFNKTGCISCNSIKNKGKKRLSHKEFFLKFNSVCGNDYELIDKYKDAKIKINVLHKTCDTIYKVSPYHFLNGTRCPYCSNRGLNQNDFLKKYKNILNEYVFIGEFKNFITKICLKHKKCGHTFKMLPSKFIIGQRCPNCSKTSSKMEAEVQAFLKLNKIKNVREYTFEDCKNINKLPFDFAIFNRKKLLFLIECDGEQHFSESKNFDEKTFKNDIIKNVYVKDKNIKLYRIKYNERIDEKIKKIFGQKYKYPNVEYIDKFYHKKITLKITSKIRNEYVKIKTSSSHSLSKKHNLSKTSILSILKYKVFENQDLHLKESIELKLKEKIHVNGKYYKFKNKMKKLYNKGISLRKIGEKYKTNHKTVKRVVFNENKT